MRGPRRLRLVAVPALVLVVAGGGVAAYASNRTSTPSYRTVAAGTGSVAQTLALTGTVEANGRADLSFTSSGKVSAVRVATGDTVKAGEVLATLDRRSLRATLRSAEADLAKARAQLASDEDGETTTVTTAATTTSSASGSGTSASGTSGSAASGSGTSSAPSSSGPGKATGSTGSPASSGSSSGSSGPSGTSGSSGSPSTGDPALTAALAALAQQQTAVTTAQSAATASLATAKSALTQQTQVCAAAFQAGSGSTPTPSASPKSAADPGSGSGSGGGSTDAQNTACTAALGAVQSAQAAAATAQDTLQAAITTLSGTLTAAIATVQKDAGAGSASGIGSGTGTGTGTGNGSGSGSGSGSASPSGSATGFSSGSSTSSTRTSAQPGSSSATGAGSSSASGTRSAGGSGQSSAATSTATQLAKDQASIDTAKVSLVAARQAMDGAVITAPFAGRVGSIGVKRGDQASSSSTAVTLISKEVSKVSVSATADQVGKLRVGQAAEITPPGASRALSGTVASIGRLPSSTSTETTYPVMVLVNDRHLTMPVGSTASVDAVVGRSHTGVTVPSSAVTRRSSTAGTVLVLSDGEAVRRTVTIGVVGRTRTSVTQGLTKGTRVVLADQDEAVPTSSTTTNRFRQGGLGGGGFGGGSFGGGFGGGVGGPPGGDRG